MLLADVIKVIGNESLDEFPWGCVVVDTINLFVEEEYRLKPNSTGQAIDRALGSLDDNVKDLVLKANLDTRSCRITTPVGGGMVVEFDEQVPSTKEEVLRLKRAIKSPIFLTTSVFVGTGVILALSLMSLLPGHGGIDWIALGKLVMKFTTF